MFSVFQCLQAKIQRASGGFGLWGAVIHQAALSFPSLLFHSWMAFKTLVRASQHWKTWREEQKWCERFVLVLVEQDCWQPHAGSVGSGLVANPLLIHKVNYLVLWSRPALRVRIHVPDRELLLFLHEAETKLMAPDIAKYSHVASMHLSGTAVRKEK